MSESDYRAHYCAGTPIGLLGDPVFGSGERVAPAPLDLADFPLAASISPSDVSDYRHALGDAALWGAVNAVAIRRRWIEPFLSRCGSAPFKAWSNVLALASGLSSRLHRRVEGGHLFFMGEAGASATVTAIIELLDETRAVRADLDRMFEQDKFCERC
jgi:hypothetical protein